MEGNYVRSEGVFLGQQLSAAAKNKTSALDIISHNKMLESLGYLLRKRLKRLIETPQLTDASWSSDVLNLLNCEETFERKGLT